MVDAPYELTSDRCKDISINPKTDYDAGTLIAVQSLVGTVWLFIGMFAYYKNVLDLKLNN